MIQKKRGAGGGGGGGQELRTDYPSPDQLLPFIIALYKIRDWRSFLELIAPDVNTDILKAYVSFLYQVECMPSVSLLIITQTRSKSH